VFWTSVLLFLIAEVTPAPVPEKPEQGSTKRFELLALVGLACIFFVCFFFDIAKAELESTGFFCRALEEAVVRW